MTMQLTLTGEEIPHEQVVRARRAAWLSENQRAILRYARAREGVIRSSEAGRIMHAARGRCPYWTDHPMRQSGLMCCGFCATDGHSALRRLAARGFLHQLGDGRWSITGRLIERTPGQFFLAI